jgi:protein-disulfide isomerase
MPKLHPPVNKSDHIRGLPGAPIELVEYGDYQCPHCGAAHPVTKELQSGFGEDLCFIYRHFPLSNIHPMAIPAAVAAEAAARQHQFWAMHDMIFENQQQLSDFALLEFARILRLNLASFKMDLQDPTLFEKIESHFESGVRSGVNGTPTFFINGERYSGNYTFESMSEAIDMIMHKIH